MVTHTHTHTHTHIYREHFHVSSDPLPCKLLLGGRSGRMVVGFKTTCAISAYHHYNWEFEPRLWATCTWFNNMWSSLSQVCGFPRVLWFPQPITLTTTIKKINIRGLSMYRKASSLFYTFVNTLKNLKFNFSR
jgi:hypothetical protein